MPGELRPRYGRIGALAGAVAVSGTALLGGAGTLPAGPAASYAETPAPPRAGDNTGDDTGDKSGDRTGADPPEAVSLAAERPTERRAPAAAFDLPARSGDGKRVVFDMSDQRVWLVGEDGTVQRTYLVSGSVYDNLRPGSYEVYSRSRHATGIDGSTMEHMVRFTRGENAAIGFHDIPYAQGRPLQTTDQLGTPLSHGCIRQAEPDARALWRFAPVGTMVVVTA